MTWTVCSTARVFCANSLAAQQELFQQGCRIVSTTRPCPLPEQQLIEFLADADAVIAANDAYTSRFFQSCPRLKVIARYGVGIDSIDLPAATASGVIVTNTPGAMTQAVADYCFAMILCSVRSVSCGEAAMRGGQWPNLPGMELSGKTLGLIGFGSIGQAVARRAVGFDLRVITHDPFLEANRVSGLGEGVEFVDLDRLFRESDIVSVHAPNTPENRHLVNEYRLRQMRPTAYLVNTARGGLIDEQALVTALRDNVIAGAAVDVYQQEPLPMTHPFRTAPRLLITPHSAFNSLEAVERMSHLCVRSVLIAMAGGRPDGTCNPDVWTQATLRVGR